MSRKSRSTRYVSLRTSMAVTAVLVTMVSVLVTIGLLFQFVVRPYMLELIRLRLLNVVKLAALQIDTDALATLGPGDQDSATYAALKAQLIQIRDLSVNTRFVYTMRQNEQGQIVFLVDAEPEDSPLFSSLFEVYAEPSPRLVEILRTMDTALVEDGFYTDEYGTFLSAYAPLYTSDGQPYGILGVDLDVSTWLLRQRQIIYSGVAVILLLLPFIVLTGWLIGRQLAAPVQRLVVGAQRIAEGDLDYEVVVTTRDEIRLLGEAFNTMTAQLRQIVGRLEQRVAERTADLQRQATYLRAAGEVGRVAASILNWNELLEQAVQLVSDRFGFYHAGVFLLDESGEWAVMRAASSPGGRRMLARGHRLGVGSQSIVGYVTQTSRPRIALDVGEDAVWFDNPDLPETRSEMALPLVVRGRVIGALDVQSRESGAFGSEDVATLRILADQIAIAIANAQLFEESRRAFIDLERAYGTEVRRSWLTRMQELMAMGYRYTPTSLDPLAAGEHFPVTEIAQPTVAEGNLLLVPLRLSGVTLGVLRLKRDPRLPWTSAEIEFVERSTVDITQALQNVNLVEQTRMAAARDRLVAEVADRLRGSLDPDMILKNTVKELGQALGAQLVSVELASSPGGAADETPAPPNKRSGAA